MGSARWHAHHALVGAIILSAWFCVVTGEVAFAPLPAALTNSTRHKVLVSPSATLGAAVQLELNVLARTAWTAPGASFAMGQLVAADGSPIYLQSGGVVSSSVDISVNPDFQSFIKASDSTLYLVSQFESPQPAVIYVSRLQQDEATGKLTIVSSVPVDLSAVGGAWTLCAGQRTPWNSHMGGEEYEPDARILEEATTLSSVPSTVIQFMRYFGKYTNNTTLADVKALFKPYKYGHVVDVRVGAGGSVTAEKYYTMGRNSKEIAFVMPNRRTVYITDDGTNVGFFRFIAKRPNDMSEGSLYAAKFTQTGTMNGGAFDITWILLGSAKDGELKSKAETTVFSDIFTYAKPAANGSCPEGFKSVNAGERLQECLLLKPGAEKWAAFFETRRYAAYLGATTEFSKLEGITYSPKRRKLYAAMTEIRYGMEDFKRRGVASTTYDIGGNNDIRLPYNPCGCIYELDVNTAQDATKMRALLCGTTEGMVDADNPCSVEGIASPDNVNVMERYNTLLISEDTGEHLNNYVWAYHLDTGSLTRIASTPLGAEATSVDWYDNLNGFSYMMVASQHPDAIAGKPLSKEGYIGYFVAKTTAIQGRQLQFAQLPVPRSADTQEGFIGTKKLVAGVTKATQFNTLYRSGQVIDGVTIGELLNINQQPIKVLGADLKPTSQAIISNNPDHTTFLQTCGSLHLVAQYEETPALIYSMDLVQTSNGSLSVANPHAVDFSAYGGLWYPCAGTPTPWQSHLGSEEYEPDAKTLARATSVADVLADPESGIAIIAQMRYFNKYLPEITLADITENFKPYLYGRVTEVMVDKNGCTKGLKHFALGRGSIELAHVLGDKRTVLITEDGQNDAFYKFVADKAGSLSSGTLYAAKFTQTSASNGGQFDISWIKLGKGSDSVLQAQAKNVTFSDIFELQTPDASGNCDTDAGFKSANTGYAGQECLKLKPKMEGIAPFMETRRYAALLGASTELNKAEGLALDIRGKRAFLAITSVEKGMEDAASKGKPSTKFDVGSSNDFRLPYNPCGCVYQLDLDAAFSPIRMKAIICGQPTADPINKCSLEGISNPDNLDYMDGNGAGTLLIGEDTGNHQNDVMWAYDLADGTLTRIFSTPYGSETTSPQFYRNINGFGYIVGVVQHPYSESDQGKVSEPESTGLAAWTGYIGPLMFAGAPVQASCNDNAGICST